MHSLHAVLSGEVPAESFRDKVVLVGIAAKTVKDLVNTPLQADGFGVLLHGQAVEQLLRAALNGAQPLRSWTEWQEGLWIVLLAFCGGGLSYYFRSPTVLSLALVAGGILLWTTYHLLFDAGFWIPVVAPAAAFFPAAGLVTSCISYQEKNQRALLMHLFSRHVSRDIAENVWAQRHLFLDGDRPRPQKLVATVPVHRSQGIFLDFGEAGSGAAHRLAESVYE